MASMRFSVKPRSDGMMDIRAMLDDGKIRYKNTGYAIPSTKIKAKSGKMEYKYWDSKKHRVKNHKEEGVINKLLIDWETRFIDYQANCTLHKTKIDFSAFRESLPEIGEEKQPIVFNEIDASAPGLLQLAEQFYKSTEKTHKPGTRKQYKTNIEDIRNYELHYKTSVKLTDVGSEWYKQFGLYLIAAENNINSTINRKITRIVTIMHSAFPKYITTQFYKKKYRFKERSENVGRFALWQHEQDAFEQVEALTEYEHLVKDGFILSYETTLRFSDIKELYPSHRHNIPVGDGKTIPILDLTQVKTTHLNTLPLTDKALEIWNRRATDPNSAVFPLMNSQTASEVLKVLCKRAGLNRKVEIVREQGKDVFKETKELHEVISYHMSRNTAITNQLSILPPPLVMKNAGIKKMETVMRYFRDDEINRLQKSRDAMNK
jgi:hypothetical protein